MSNKDNYRVAIDIMCCHLGMSFDEACKELGLDMDDSSRQIAEVQESLLGIHRDER